MAAATTGAIESRDILLSPDERYELWIVKAAERPELLEAYCDDEELHNSAVDDDELPPPLTDGCDIPGWRRASIIPIASPDLLAALQVGQGCSLLRREGQLPVVSRKSFEPWENLRQRLFQAPTTDVERIKYTSDMALYTWFERENVPVILDGCTRDWTAMESCTFAKLVERFGDFQWRFSDTHGETMTLRSYEKYIYSLEGQTDDAPLAIYDSQFGYDERAPILEEYSVPGCFDTDLFALLPDIDRRPPYRWILIGPERSGTGLHVDPVGTHAWVTLVEGCKRWVLFPAGTSPDSIHMQDPQIPSVIWFRDHYETALYHHPNAVEILQRPGETVYVPAGWPHLVLNLELSVAITHNYATEYPSMERLWRAVVQAEPELAQRFLKSLRTHRPDLAEHYQLRRKLPLLRRNPSH